MTVDEIVKHALGVLLLNTLRLVMWRAGPLMAMMGVKVSGVAYCVKARRSGATGPCRLVRDHYSGFSLLTFMSE